MNFVETAQTAEDISRRLISSIRDSGLRVTIDHIDQPAYMVNASLEVTWYNEAARPWLGNIEQQPNENGARHVLQHLAQGTYGQRADNQQAFNKLHWEAGKARLASTALANGKPFPSRIMSSVLPLLLRLGEEIEERYSVDISYFREGMLFTYSRDDRSDTTLTDSIAGHNDAVFDLSNHELPALTDFSVLVATLHDASLISQQLPPEEYFELINQLGLAMETILSRFYGAYGKHAEETAVVYYFFPRKGSNYLFDTIRCSSAIRTELRRISQHWQLRKDWVVDLKFKIALHEGREWLGIQKTRGRAEIKLLGHTINQAARLADFAVGGTVWASKNLISKLSTDERRRLRYGIRRRDGEGLEVLVEGTFADVSSQLNRKRHGKKMRDLGQLVVTEIIGIIDSDAKSGIA